MSRRVIRWRFAAEPGTGHTTWSASTLRISFARIQKYWDVEFSQQARGAQVEFRLTRSAKHPAWQSGNIIYVSAAFRWGSSPAAREQMALTNIHELGHWLIGGGGHAPPGNVMAAVVGDPFQNWTEADMKWFGRLPWKGTLRPWHEPAAWRPPATGQPQEELPEIKLC